MKKIEFFRLNFDAVKLYNNCDLNKIKEIFLKYIFDRNGKQRLFPENPDKKLTKKAFIKFFDAINRNTTIYTQVKDFLNKFRDSVWEAN